MPNHTENRLTFSGNQDDINNLLESIKGIEDEKEIAIDFEKIIPMPDDISRENISFDEMQTNPYNWYTWSLANWGTKWNAYSSYMEENNTLRFLTAWSPPMPVIEALSKMFPEVEIKHEYIDEGFMYFGEVYYSNGLLEDFCYEKREQNDALFMKLAMELKNYEFDESGEIIYED